MSIIFTITYLWSQEHVDVPGKCFFLGGGGGRCRLGGKATVKVKHLLKCQLSFNEAKVSSKFLTMLFLEIIVILALHE